MNLVDAEQLRALISYLREAGLAILIGSLINVFLTLLWGLRWSYGLRRLNLNISYLKALEAVTSSLPIGNLIPGNKVAQEAFRVAYLEVPADKRSAVLSATALEWVSEGIVIGFIFMVALARHYIDMIVPAAYVVQTSETEGRSLSEKVRDAAFDFVRGVRELARDRATLAFYMATSAVIIALDMTKVYVMLKVLGVSLSLLDLITLYIAMRLTSLGPTPAGLGFMDAGVAATLAIIGVPASTIALFDLSLRLVDNVLPSLVGLAVLASTGSLRMLKAARSMKPWRR